MTVPALFVSAVERRVTGCYLSLEQLRVSTDWVGMLLHQGYGLVCNLALAGGGVELVKLGWGCIVVWLR